MKSTRHAMILELIEQKNIETQDELAALLKKRGVDVTQATISRDIKELRLIKVQNEQGIYKYATVDKAENGMKDKFRRILSHAVLSMHSCGNLVVIKTLPGTGGAACEAIDSSGIMDVVGSLAGDNTIFLAVREEEVANEVIKRINAMIQEE